MNNSRKITILILAIIVILSIILVAYGLRDNSLSQTVDGELLAERGFDIMPQTMDNAGVAVDSDFKIICQEAQDKDYIKSNLSIQPAEEYELKEISKKEYLVDFKETLKTDTVYKVSMLGTNEEELTWAFQTVKSFRLVSTLPRDKGTDVPVNTGIEMQFSYPYVENLEKCFEIEPKVEGEFVYNKDLAVFMPKNNLEPDTLYTVTVKAGVGINGSDEVIGEDYSFQFVTGTEDGIRKSYFNFFDSLYNFTSKNIPYLEVYTSDDLRYEEFNVDIYSYKKADDFIADNKKLSDADTYWLEKANIKIEIDNDLKNVSSFKTELISTDEYGATFLEFPEELAEGYYLVNVNFEDNDYQTQIQVNDSAVYIMYGENESLAWVNDTITGKAISDAVFETEEGNTAKTNSEGIAVIPYEANVEDFEQLYFKISYDNHPTYIAKISNNLYRYDYGYYNGIKTNNDYWSYLYMDRELYLPTDKMSYWGLIKARDYSEKLDSVSLHLYKYDYYTDKFEIGTKEVALDEFGCFNGEWEFTDLLPGSYYLEINNGEEIITGSYFDVRRYEKPTYTIDANFDKENIFLWENANLDIQANFFEGTPVSGLKLECSYYEDDSNRRISDIVCDKNGSYQVKYNPSFSKDSWYPTNIHMNIYNTQAEEQNINTYSQINVFPKDIMINIDTESVEGKENDEQIEIRTNLIDINKEIDLEGYISTEERYKGATIDTNIEIKLYEITHTKIETGEYYDFINKEVRKTYRYEENIELIDTISTTTNNGKYTLNIPLEDDKDYKINVQAYDTRGNKVIEEVWVNNFRYDNYYSNQKYYSIEEEDNSKDNYKVGDNINLKLTENDEDVSEKAGDKLLLLKMQDGLHEFITLDNLKYSLKFNEEDIPNYYICAVYFDGERIHLAGEKNITYDYSEKELEFTVKADKDNYRPGETVQLEFEVKDQAGNPQKTNLNVSVVDEALFELRDQYVNTLAAIYEYSYGTGIIQNYISYEDVSLYGKMMAEGGGCMDERAANMIRSEFLDTAIFKSVTTDTNGKGSISFELPDNLTSWRVTYQGVSEDLLAGNGQININTKLPYFITLILNNTYMTGDKPYVSVRSYGTETDSSDVIEYNITLENQAGDKEEFQIKANGNDYANVALGELTEGKYTITVEGENGTLYDGIQQEFEVVDSMLRSTVVDYIELDNRTKLPTDNGYTTINFYNKECSNFYNSLTAITYTWGSRVDQKLSRKIGSEMMNEYFDSELSNEEFDLEKYQIGDGGIALLPYSSSDPLLSAKIVSIAPESFDAFRLKEYFNGVIHNEDSTKVNIAAAYWGLASLNEPILLEIQSILDNEELSIKEKIVYGLGLLEFGDTKGARDIYLEIMNDYGIKSGEYTYIDTGIDKDDIIEATSLMSIMALKLDSDSKYNLLEYVNNNKAETILTNLEQLMFVNYDIPNIDQEVSFTYEIDGKKTDVKLVNTESYSLFLNEEQTKDIKFKNVNGNVTASVSYIGNIKEAGMDQAKNFDITRTYQAVGDSNNSYNQSDIIKVTIKPNFSESATEGYYEITDIIPAGLRYIQKDYRDDGTVHPIEIDGQRLVFSFYYSKDSANKPIVYHVRAAAPGTYIADNAVIMHYGSNSISLSEQEVLTIEVD